MPRIKRFFSESFFYVKTHKKFLIIPLIIIIAVGFFLFPKKKTDISTTQVKKGELLQTISTNGSLESENSVKLSFLIGGKLIYLAGKKGDTINKNAVLATLDQRTMQKNIQNALYDFSKTRNNFDQALKNNNVSSVNDAANETIRRTLENNQFDLNKSVLSVELQDLAKEESVLVSPISGIITRADVDSTGVNVSPTTVYEVTDPDSMQFKMEIDEADIGKIKEGQKVKVNIDAYPDEDLTLTIMKIDFNTHTTSTGGDAFYVWAKLTSNNSDYKYRAGMNGSAEVEIDRKNDVLLIPISSIFDDDKVYVKNGKKFEKKTIKLGAQNDTDAVVIDGLNEGDEIATDPSQIN